MYQVSDLGRVKSLRRYRKGKGGALTYCRERILHQQKGKNGYIQVCLCKDNKKSAPTVHRLVGKAFLPNENNLPCIDHIDGNRENNTAGNLRWCTVEENMNYDIVKKNISHVQRSNERCRKHQRDTHEKIKRPIVAIFPDGRVREYPSAKDAEADGFEHSNIAACCRKKIKTHLKCRFYYKEDYEQIHSA